MTGLAEKYGGSLAKQGPQAPEFGRAPHPEGHPFVTINAEPGEVRRAATSNQCIQPAPHYEHLLENRRTRVPDQCSQLVLNDSITQGRRLLVASEALVSATPDMLQTIENHYWG
jgi:hypothetical protein